MINKLLKRIAYYSHVAVTYTFWLYFGVYVFFNKRLPMFCRDILLLLLGIYVGYSFAVWANGYLKNYKEKL